MEVGTSGSLASHPPVSNTRCNDNRFALLQCSSCGASHKAPIHCNSRFCSECNNRRQIRLRSKYEFLDRYLESPYFLTLTLKNKQDIKKNIKKIRSCFLRLLERYPYNRIFAGGAYAIEVNVSKNSKFNVHMHIVVDSLDLVKIGFFPRGSFLRGWDIKNSKLSKDWYDITNDSYIVYWQKCNYPRQCVKYITKYITDPEKLNFEKKYQFKIENAIKKTRLISLFGVCYGYNINNQNKPKCNVCGTFGSFEYKFLLDHNYHDDWDYNIQDLMWAG